MTLKFGDTESIEKVKLAVELAKEYRQLEKKYGQEVEDRRLYLERQLRPFGYEFENSKIINPANRKM